MSPVIVCPHYGQTLLIDSDKKNAFALTAKAYLKTVIKICLNTFPSAGIIRIRYIWPPNRRFGGQTRVPGIANSVCTQSQPD